MTETTKTTTRVDAASLAVFRVGFGALMLIATVRFAARGWIDEILDRPTFHFTFTFFEWVKPLPQPWLDVQYAVMAVSASLLMLGVRARLAAGVFFVLFTWAELVEKAAYLNHYFFVSLMALLLTVVRTDQCCALWPEARGVDRGDGRVDVRLLWLFRGQVIVVYAAAGLAKVSSDWLVHAEPLRIWLQHTAHLSVIGPLLSSTFGAHAFSIGGCLFDLTIWAFILWRRTRVVAYVVAIFFHLTVWALFPIGLFSPVMLLAATLLFSPSWPRRFLRSPPVPATTTTTTKWPTLLVAAWLMVQVLLPLRHYAIPGATNWTELGFRFAWRVMLIEKTGVVEYRVVVDGHPAVRVFPDELTELQRRQLRTQPDMIRHYARHLRDRFADAGGHDVAAVHVYADAWASLNGRASQRLIDPAVDLAAVDDSLWSAPWIVPLQTPFPMRVTPSRTGGS